MTGRSPGPDRLIADAIEKALRQTGRYVALCGRYDIDRIETIRALARHAARRLGWKIRTFKTSELSPGGTIDVISRTDKVDTAARSAVATMPRECGPQRRRSAPITPADAHSGIAQGYTDTVELVSTTSATHPTTVPTARPSSKATPISPANHNRSNDARRLRRSTVVATWAGRVLTLAAVVSLVSIPFRHWSGTDVITDLMAVVNVPADPSIFVVCLVLALAGAIRRRLWLAHAALLLVMIGMLVEDSVVLASFLLANADAGAGYWAWGSSTIVAALILVVGLGVFVVVARARPAFTGRLAPGSVRAALIVLVSGLSVSFLVTLLLTAAFPRTLSGWVQVTIWAARSAFGERSTAGDPLLQGHLGHHGIYALAGWMSALSLLVALLVLWRSNRINVFQDAADELRVRELLATYGENDSLGYFATRRDKSVVFAPDGNAAVTFRTVGSVSVASADPIGDRGSWPAAATTWLELCQRRGLHAAVLAAGEDGARVYRSVGLKTLAIGDEAIIDVDEFSLRGSAMKPVRQAVNRVTTAGYTTQIRRHADLTTAELSEIEVLAGQWRGEDTERGFSMALNRIGDPTDGQCLLVTAHDREGDIRAFLSFVPWGERGVSLDLMRRDRSAENGINEYLVATLIATARERGIGRISLNFAVFRSVFSDAERVGAGPITRATDSFLGFASKFYQLKSLYRSNQKYRPQWVPRTLCYQPSLTVIRAAVATGIAEGFLPHIGPALLVGPKTPDKQLPRTEEFAASVKCLTRQACREKQCPDTYLNEQQRIRHATRESLLARGYAPYPVTVHRTHTLAAIRSQYGHLDPDVHTTTTVSVTGRIRAIRDFGGLVFVTLEEDGHRIQILAMAVGKAQGKAVHSRFRRDIDLGDLIGITGTVATSKTGELSIRLQNWQMVGKCLSPVPPIDVELADDVRARNRTLDLITHRAPLAMLEQRARGVRALRESLHADDFIEVETPMLQTVHGGAAARPFTTHINAYDQQLSLRIAPELYLKRLCVAGMGRIYELNRNFRNEGADSTHNPEFTSLEVYQAYADYNTMKGLAQTLICAMATAIHGAQVAERPSPSGEKQTVDLNRPWPTMTVHDAVSAACRTAITTTTPAAELAEICAAHRVPTAADMSAGHLVMALYETLVEKHTDFPTFYIDFPVEVSPLARRHRDDPRVAEHWDLVGFGMELGTAYSEQTDPVLQRERLTSQSLAAAGGDPDAMHLDEDFLAALNYAMPPTGGLGLGVDRLVMMLTGGPIRSTLSFPFVRPRHP